MRRRGASAAAAAAIAVSACAARSAAAEPLGSRQSFWQASLAVRTSYIGDPGLDPFATNDALTQLGLSGSRTVLVDGPRSLALGAAWEVGGRSAGARGVRAHLVVHRLSVPVEGRWHLAPWVYGFARAAPGASHLAASLDDAGPSGEPEAGFWTPSLDLDAGAAFLVGPGDAPAAHPLRWWLGASGGWGWTGRHELSLAPDADGPVRTGPVELGSIALRGPFFRLTVATSF